MAEMNCMQGLWFDVIHLPFHPSFILLLSI